MSYDIRKYLDDLESRINIENEENILSEWIDFVKFTPREGVFVPKRIPAPQSSFEWEKVYVNDAILDTSYEAMLLAQLTNVNNMMTSNIGNFLNIRANYGCNIIATMMGCKIHLLDRELDTLPAALPLEGGFDEIKKIMAKGVPSLESGQAKFAFEAMNYYDEMLASYPKLKKYIKIFHPDFQAAIDSAEIICGSEIFLKFYDEPEFLKDLFDYISEIYIQLIEKFFKEHPTSAHEEYNQYFNILHRGKIHISMDSCMNISPEIYREFVFPHDELLLKKYGGMIHSCGRLDHYVDILPEIGEGYYGLNLTQPEYNDMEKIYASTIDKGIPILSLPPSEAVKLEKSKRKNRELVHSTSLNF